MEGLHPSRAATENAVAVLAVDDSEAFLSTADELVGATSGFRVAGHASSGAEALVVAQRTRPDMVLVDLRMPDMDGVETARRLAAICPHAVIVLVSSAEPPDVPSSVELSGAAAFVPKQELTPAVLRRLWAERA